MPEAGVLKQRIANALNRDDLGSYIDTWLETSHLNIQNVQDWKAQEEDYGVAATSILWNITLPTDFRAPILLARVAGLTTTVALVPTSFYVRQSYQDVLSARLNTNETLLATALAAEELTPIYDIYENRIEIFPENDVTSDHFRLLYYKIMSLPIDGVSDWFTTNCADFLLYDSLLQAIPFLGGNDDRIQNWTVMRDRALQRAIGINVNFTYGGASLVMRG